MGKKNKLQVSTCAVNPICENICRFTLAQWHADLGFVDDACFSYFETFSLCIRENLNSSAASQGSLSVSTLQWSSYSYLSEELILGLVGLHWCSLVDCFSFPFGGPKYSLFFSQLYQDRSKHKIDMKLFEKTLLTQSSPRNKKHLTGSYLCKRICALFVWLMNRIVKL